MSEGDTTLVRRLIAPLERRVKLSLSRAITSLVNDSIPLQQVQITLLSGETVDNADRVQEYGFTSVPQPGAEAVTAFMAGDRSHGVIIAVDDRRYRLQGLQNGEVALYTDEGDKVHFQRGRVIAIETQTLNMTAGSQVNIITPELNITASSQVMMATPEVQATGAIAAAGNLSSQGDIIDRVGSAGGSSMAAMRAVYDPHTHQDTGDGTTTSPPSPQM